MSMKSISFAVYVTVLGLALFFSVVSASAYYEPGMQRWLNRDPIGESGGANLFGLVVNNPVNIADAFGLLAPVAPPLPVPGPIVGPKPPIILRFPEPILYVCVVNGIMQLMTQPCYTDPPPTPKPSPPSPPPTSCLRDNSPPYQTERCDKTSDRVDTTTGRRFCAFTCTKSGTHMEEGTGCDKQFYYRVVP